MQAAKDARSYRRTGRSALRPHAPAGSLQPLFAQISESADVLVLCGDLTDYGLAEEARVLVRELSAPSRSRSSPCSATTTSSRASRTRSRTILVEAGVTVLDGDSCEIHGIGFAGVKGFAGGFGRGALGPWGEETSSSSSRRRSTRR